MRFCMVTTFYPPYHFGGDAIFVQALARALTAEGHEVEVVHCENAYRLRKQETPISPTESDGIIVHRLHSPLGWLSPLITQQTGRPGLKTRALRSIFNRDFDVVNFHNISLVGGPGVLSMSKAPVNFYTLHEHWLLCPMHIFWKNRTQACDRPQCLRCCLYSGIPPQLWRYTGLIERSLAKVDAFLSPSEYTAERHRAAGLTQPIHVLPTFSSLDLGSIGKVAPAGRPCFLYVGRVTASKGIAVLLEEFAQLPEYNLLVVGDGDLRLMLQQQYTEHRHIRFLGALSQQQLGPLYQKVTALVLPSLAPEVFPLSVLEAFACGTPAIVHNAGGNREAIDKTGGGFVYESREGLRQALSTLAKDAQLRDSLGQRGRAGYERYYSRERYVAGYLNLIETVGKTKGAIVINKPG
jgi:glycosyltransferase involved in cell wall biosynthesis